MTEGDCYLPIIAEKTSVKKAGDFPGLRIWLGAELRLNLRPTDFWLSVLSALSSSVFLCFSPPVFKGHSRHLPYKFLGGLVGDPGNGRVIQIAIRYLAVASVFCITIVYESFCPHATRINVELRSIGLFWMVRELFPGDPGNRAECVTAGQFHVVAMAQAWKQSDQVWNLAFLLFISLMILGKSLISFSLRAIMRANLRAIQ